MSDSIEAGDNCTVIRDVYVAGELAFTKGEPVIVKKIDPNPQKPDFKYVIFSPRLQRHFQLSGSDISPAGELGSAVGERLEPKAAPAEKATPYSVSVEQVAGLGSTAPPWLPKTGESRAKEKPRWLLPVVVMGIAVVVVGVALILYLFPRRSLQELLQ